MSSITTTSYIGSYTIGSIPIGSSNIFTTYPGPSNWMASGNINTNKNLSEIPYKETLAVLSAETIKDYLYKITFGSYFTYNLFGNNYFTLVENDLSDELVNATKLSEFYTLRRGLAVVAYDMEYNRLEISAICKEEESISNIDYLLDDTLAVKKNKKEYFSSLKSRFLPIVGFKFLDFSNEFINLKKNINTGLLPVIHVPNYIYNLSTNPKNISEFLKPSKLIEELSSEVYLVNKSVLPDIQPNFSPEYSYLSLIENKATILRHFEAFDKSRKGLINLLTNITIPGTNVASFIDLVIDYCALNQSITDIEGYAYIMIRNLIESNLI